ncbi:hypothetical protein SAMN05660420_02889 [Desulfuromusa kysingii]|uniref:Uncharacterized protein n=1 Tax=Desulfuromusa kysingii TaxID=37625 RepID=A0A1H4DD48_9BACT|nr:hypothetical protein [Desulfuromusa kysingii]SEA70547.1 hypothetical protein SAMN05660420_02889 [Desulfuromusa kysingii]
MKALLVLGFLLLPTILMANEADVVRVEVDKVGSGYRFDVTVQHHDEGWQHYANKWEVVTADGQVLATRVLHHPHVNEQPFTRSLSGVEIAAEISSVIIRAHDLVHGYGGEEMTVMLPK